MPIRNDKRGLGGGSIIAIVGAVIVIMLLVTAMGIANNSFSVLPGATNTTEQIANYIIFKTDAGLTAAKNCSSNRIDDVSSNSSRVIQYALDHSPGDVSIKAGYYECTYDIYMNDNNRLLGAGKYLTNLNFTSKSTIWMYDSSNVELGHMKITGMVRIEPVSVTKYTSNIYIHDILVTSDNSWISSFFVYAANHYALDNVTFERCDVIGSGCSGFLLSADNVYPNFPDTITNITFRDCKAIDCGRYSRYNNWSVGFDVAELNSAKNILVEGCYASGNWESGFHSEYAPIKADVRFINCLSENNGWAKQSLSYSTYGAGYVFASGIQLIGCIARNNAYHGFLGSNERGSAILIGCNDYNSTIGFSIGGKLGQAILSDCGSYFATRYAIELLSAGNITTNNFMIYYPQGIGRSTSTYISSYTYPSDNLTLDVIVFGNHTSIFYIECLRDSVISGNFQINNRTGIFVSNPYNVTFRNCKIKTPHQGYGIYVIGNKTEQLCQVYDTVFLPYGGNDVPDYGIVNQLGSNTTVVVASDVYAYGISVKAFNCKYFEKSNWAYITGANISVNVTHQLINTPREIIVTARQTGQGDYAVTFRNETIFTITFTNIPGASTWTFDWYARYYIG